MNITIKCPACGQVLAVPPNLAGRQANCPKCKAPFQIPAAPPAPRPLPVAQPLTAPVPPPPRSGPPPLPRSAATTGSAPAPSSGFDLESLGISSDGASYVSHGSSAGAHGAAKKRPLLPGMPKWVVGAVAASVVLVVAAFAGWMILGVKASIGDDARFLPDDTNFVFTIDVKSLVNSGVGQKFKEQLSDLHEIPGAGTLKIDDIGRVTFGGQIAGEKFCAIAHFNRPVSIDDLWNSDGGAKTTIGAYTVRSLEDGKMAAAQIDPQLILFGNKQEVKKVLTRNGLPKMNEALSAVLSEVDFGKPIAAAAAFNGLTQAAAAAGAVSPAVSAAADQVRGVGGWADVGDDIRLNAAVVCKDSTAAENFRKQIDAAKTMFTSFSPAGTGDQNANVAKILNSLSVSASGATVRASVAIDSGTLTGWITAARAAADSAMAAGRSSPSPTSGNANKPKPRTRKPKKSKDTAA